jgi:hypothetical protein
MPVEEIETTETVERTTTEEITICDSCGINNDSGNVNVYTFRGRSGKFDDNLYFCGECLDNENLSPMADRITTPYSQMVQQPKEATAITIASFTTCCILGYAAGGIGGLVGGAVLLTVLMFIAGILVELVK